MPKKKKRKSTRPPPFKPAKVKRKLDRLFSELILGRDQRTCQWCGRKTDETGRQLKMDNSHIIPREILVTRWNPKNSVCLCFGCHKRRGISWHSSPLHAVQWLRAKIGDAWCDTLLLLATRPFEFNRSNAEALEWGLRADLDKMEEAKTEEV